tara:strand:+ start:77 stop:643 length:567 start_codon:yes stop_codon:yes gene_type:complete
MSYKLPLVNFQEEMTNITTEYGAQKFSGRKMSLIYDCVKTLKPEQFKKVINEILMEGGYAPPPKLFKKHAEPFIRLNYENEKIKQAHVYADMFTSEQLGYFSKGLIQGLGGDLEVLKKITTGLKKFSKAKCKHCNDLGIVWAVEVGRENHPDKPFNCFCVASKNDPRFINWGSRFDGIMINKNLREIA